MKSWSSVAPPPPHTIYPSIHPSIPSIPSIAPYTTSNFDFSLENAVLLYRHMERMENIYIIYHRVAIPMVRHRYCLFDSVFGPRSFSFRSFLFTSDISHLPRYLIATLPSVLVSISLRHFSFSSGCVHGIGFVSAAQLSNGTQSNCRILRR